MVLVIVLGFRIEHESEYEYGYGYEKRLTDSYYKIGDQSMNPKTILPQPIPSRKKRQRRSALAPAPRLLNFNHNSIVKRSKNDSQGRAAHLGICKPQRGSTSKPRVAQRTLGILETYQIRQGIRRIIRDLALSLCISAATALLAGCLQLASISTVAFFFAGSFVGHMIGLHGVWSLIASQN
jgi:hypothetical protein